MAYEGMDAPEVSHIACLTHIRSVPWLEQMVARATRFDPAGGRYEEQTAVVYHPDDFLFRSFRRAIEAEQSGRARVRKRSEQGELPFDGPGQDELPLRPALQPLRSEATSLRFEVVHPRAHPTPGLALRALDGQGGLPETPAQAEQRLRRQVGQMVAAQVIEDVEAGLVGQPWGYHAYNSVLKRVFGKPRGTMSLAELEAVIGWLERNRACEHLDLIEAIVHDRKGRAEPPHRRAAAPRDGHDRR
jgi:hypothetical protein